MTDGKPLPPKPQKRIEKVAPEGGVPLHYANYLEIGHTYFDVRLLFGEVSDVNDERVEVSMKAQITLSWLEAKVLADFLKTHIDEYERLNGPIKTELASLKNLKVPNFPREAEPK